MFSFWKRKSLYNAEEESHCMTVSAGRPARIGFFATVGNIWRTLERLTFALEQIQKEGIITIPFDSKKHIHEAEYRAEQRGYYRGFSEGQRRAISFPFERPTTTRDFGGL